MLLEKRSQKENPHRSGDCIQVVRSGQRRYRNPLGYIGIVASVVGSRLPRAQGSGGRGGQWAPADVDYAWVREAAR